MGLKWARNGREMGFTMPQELSVRGFIAALQGWFAQGISKIEMEIKGKGEKKGKGKEKKGKERKGKERKGKERKGNERIRR